MVGRVIAVVVCWCGVRGLKGTGLVMLSLRGVSKSANVGCRRIREGSESPIV